MRPPLNLGDHNSRWTTDQEKRLIGIVTSEFGENHRHLDDKTIEAVLDQIEQKYNVGLGKERRRNGIRLRLIKLRDEIGLHVFQEYERFHRDKSSCNWKGSVSRTVDIYHPDEIDAVDRRKEDPATSFKPFIRHELDKDRGTEDLSAAGYVGLDWIVEGETAYYVTPKIQDVDYARMFVDIFTLDREDNVSERQTLVSERQGMYRIDLDRSPIPVSKKHQYLGISVFTELLLVHLVDMIRIIPAGDRFTTGTSSHVRSLIQRARSCALISEQAECVISGFLEKKEKDATRGELQRDFFSEVNPANVYDGASADDYASRLDTLERILSSAEDRSQNLIVPPFRIDMPKLFELYFYYLLTKMDDGSVKPLIRYQFPCTIGAFNGVSKSGKPRPDFLIEGKGLLIDAKYKVDYNDEAHYSARDVCQVLSYTRINSVVKVCQAEGEIKTVIAFSSTGDIPDTTSLQDLYDRNRTGVVDQNEDVIELYKCAIPLPKTR